MSHEEYVSLCEQVIDADGLTADAKANIIASYTKVRLASMEQN